MCDLGCLHSSSASVSSHEQRGKTLYYVSEVASARIGHSTASLVISPCHLIGEPVAAHSCQVLRQKTLIPHAILTKEEGGGIHVKKMDALQEC